MHTGNTVHFVRHLQEEGESRSASRTLFPTGTSLRIQASRNSPLQRRASHRDRTCGGLEWAARERSGSSENIAHLSGKSSRRDRSGSDFGSETRFLPCSAERWRKRIAVPCTDCHRHLQMQSKASHSPLFSWCILRGARFSTFGGGALPCKLRAGISVFQTLFSLFLKHEKFDSSLTDHIK